MSSTFPSVQVVSKVCKEYNSKCPVIVGEFMQQFNLKEL